MDYSLVSDLTSDWSRLLHTVIVGTLTYAGLIVWLRVSGKRTLSKWNAFDFIVTIALGSMLASALLTPDVSFSQAMVAVGLLVSYQFLLTWLSVRSGVVQNLIKARPTLLFFKGDFLEPMLKHERVAEGEVLAAIRLSGKSHLADIDAVVLETDGSFSVIENVEITAASALKDVKGFRDIAILHGRDAIATAQLSECQKAQH
ncbi:MAG: YetF domain-containing protein [Cyanobacteria bacterium J06553_1]